MYPVLRCKSLEPQSRSWTSEKNVLEMLNVRILESRGAIDVSADEPAGETHAHEPAQSSNGLLGGPTNNDDNDAKLDIDMDAAAQEETNDMDMGFIGQLDQTPDDVASDMILMAM